MSVALTMTVMMMLGVPGTMTQAADSTADTAAVYQAALDYVEGLYAADPAKIERSVHPSLSKRGFVKDPAGQYGPMATMTYDQLLALTARWNKDRTRDTSIKKVEVLEVLDQTAIAKITAQWGIDYMQLAKFDGQWKIVNIMWQTHPGGTS